jgi:hypothetical protein
LQFERREGREDMGEKKTRLIICSTNKKQRKIKELLH